MKTLLATFLLLLPLAMPAAAQTAAPTASPGDVATFTALMGEMAAASQKRDTTAMSRLFAAEYRHYAPDYVVADRKKDLAFVSSPQWPFTTVALAGPVAVNRYGTTAITVSDVHFKGKEKTGEPFTQTLQMMVVWVQREGHWQIALMQSRGLPAKKAAKG